MRVFVLGSGSTGNAAIVESGGTRVLIDAGLGPKSSAARFRSLGQDLFPRGVDAIIVTHQHGDHVAQLEPLARATRAPVYLHRGIEAPRVRNRFEVREYDQRSPFDVGAVRIEALTIPHDAPQVALRFAGAIGVHGLRPMFGLATDLGCVPHDLPQFLGDCDSAILEANYCPVMLREGPYPPRLRQRVASDVGHLANDQTAELAALLATSRLATLYLGHLSRANNTPDRAITTVKRRAPTLDVRVIEHGDTHGFHVEASHRRSAPVQLGLFPSL